MRVGLSPHGFFRRKSIWLTFVAAASIASIGAHADVVQVIQTKRAFVPSSVDLKVGDILHIVNADEFIHNIYVDSSAFHFDSEEQEPGHTLDIKFPQPGDYEVHCHIHLKMKLEVHVH